MSSFQQRLVEVMREHGVANAPQLSKLLGYSGSERIRLVLNGTSKPSYGMLEDLARTFVFLDMRWLITGEGNMLRSHPANTVKPTVQEKMDKAFSLPPGWKKLVDDQEKMKEQLAKLLEQKGATHPKGKKAS